MQSQPASVETALVKLHVADTFRADGREFRVLFLLPETLWRPLHVSWWKGKEVCLIGGTENGNYLLRHCDGTVRLWDHAMGTDEILAPSVRVFVTSLAPRQDAT